MRVTWFKALSPAALVALAGCSDLASPADPQRNQSSAAVVQAAAGATTTYLEVPVSFEGWVTNLACLDEPIWFHVNGLAKLWITTNESVTSTRSTFAVDRPNTWVIYKGVTYHVAQGRQHGEDDVGHELIGPGDMYINVGVEPDFEVSDTGERLRLNLAWHLVIDPSGTVKVDKVNGGCQR